DLLTAFQHGDDHDVGHADAADEQGDGAEAEEQGVQGALGVGLGGERGRGLGHGDLVRVLGAGLVGEQMVDSRGGLLGRQGADIDLRGMAVKVQVLLGGGEADQDGGVEFGGVGVGAQDAGDVQPLAAGPDPHSRPDPVDAQELGGGGAEDGGGLAGGGGVEVAALRDAGAGHGGQAEGGGVDAQAAGLDGGDERGLVDVHAGDGGGGLHRGDAGQAGDHAGCGLGELGRSPGQGLAVGDGEQVGAQGLDLGQ